MAATTHIQPTLVFADEAGNIYDHPDLLMLCRRGAELTLPRPDELMPLPEESEFFLLPGRGALGFDPETGQVEELEELAVAVFASPAHTLSAAAAYRTRPGAPTLPLFAYGAVGFAEGKFWVCARKVDQDRRQVFTGIPRERIENGARKLLTELPGNRLVRHLTGCALTYGCPAAKNLALGRFEAPLPTSRTCNARCVGCISFQPEDSGFPSTQNRIAFKPTEREVADVMRRHAGKEKRAILSFGQGCEGEPLTEAELIRKSVQAFRKDGGQALRATVNVNTNASRPEVLPDLAAAGVDSIRVSLNSARRGPYEAYYRPNGYAFEGVRASIHAAKEAGLFVSLNLLYFPGLTDCELEWDALAELITATKLDFVQMRNMNLDPELLLGLMSGQEFGPCMGLANFLKRLKKTCPWIDFGYFNPYITDRNL